MKRQHTLRQCVATLAVAGLLAGTQLTFARPAAAGRSHYHGSSYSYSYGGYRPYYGSHYRYPYRYRHGGYRYSHYRNGPYRHGGVGIGIHGHGSDAALAVGALGAGLLLGHLLTRQQRDAPAPSYAKATSPAIGYGKQARRGCKPTTGSGLYQGRRATFGGTFCYDANGQGYIVPGSEYLIGYAN